MIEAAEQDFSFVSAVTTIKQDAADAAVKALPEPGSIGGGANPGGNCDGAAGCGGGCSR